MLKKDPYGEFRYTERGFFTRKRYHRFYSGKNESIEEIDDGTYEEIMEQQENTPVVVMSSSEGRKRWWIFQDNVYWEDEGFTAEEMKVLILEKIDQRQKKIQRAMARVSQKESSAIRQHIPDDVKLFVWQRDEGRCVNCGSPENLEFDHIIPISKGGSNTARNLQILCEACNRAKGANLT
jgi:5-methylcytosine-specific restriction endonuclease McrA